MVVVLQETLFNGAIRDLMNPPIVIMLNNNLLYFFARKLVSSVMGCLLLVSLHMIWKAFFYPLSN